MGAILRAFITEKREILEQSSSGAFFTAMVKEVIQKNGVVYGASFTREWKLETQRAETLEEARKFCGAKYLYGVFVDAIKAAGRDLQAGRMVLFSGLPCQIAAARKLLGTSEKLLLVETACHGAPEAKYWDEWLEEKLASLGKSRTELSAVNFRDKRNGWERYNVTLQFTDGAEESSPHWSNEYMRAFLQNYTLRRGCFVCPFKLPAGSNADLTIADFWGAENFLPGHLISKGCSLVCINTPAGERAVQNIRFLEGKWSLEDVASYNPSLIHRPEEPAKRKAFLRACEKHPHEIAKMMKKYTTKSLVRRVAGRIVRFFRQSK